MDGWCPLLTKMPLDRPNYYPGRNGWAVMATVEHIADGYPTLEGLRGWFSRVTTDDDPGSSAHAYIRRNGTGAQYISMLDGAWANGPINHPDRSIVWLDDCVRRGINPNLVTFTIEHEGKPGDVMTEPQYRLSLEVNRWALRVGKYGASSQTLVGHNRIDDVNRHYCPGPSFPWARLLTDLKGPAVTLPGKDRYEAEAWGPVYRATEWIGHRVLPPKAITSQPLLQEYEAYAWAPWYKAAQFWLGTGDPDDYQDGQKLLWVLGSNKDYHEVQPPTGHELSDSAAYREAFAIFNGNKTRHGG